MNDSIKFNNLKKIYKLDKEEKEERLESSERTQIKIQVTQSDLSRTENPLKPYLVTEESQK